MAPYRTVVVPPTSPRTGGQGQKGTGSSNRNMKSGSNRDTKGGSNRKMNTSSSNRNSSTGAKRPVRDSTLISTNQPTTGDGKNSSKRQIQYQPVRSKRSLEASAPSSPSTPQLLPEAPMDGPWQRAKNEWKDPLSWFGIDDCGRLLDVPHTFGGSQTIYKWILWAIMMATLIYLWSTADNLWFLGDLDHWALLLATFYQTLSLANGHIHPPQPANADGKVNLYIKIFWVIFEIAAHLELLTCVMFWAFVFPQDYENIEIDYGLFALHGIILIGVWIDGMVLNRIPVRVKHYLFVLIVDAVYVLWTGVHALAGWENGTTDEHEEGSQTNSSDAIYIAFDWNNETKKSVLLMILMLTAIAPLLFTFQYLMSLYSFPCTWNGSKSRKVIEWNQAMTNRNNNNNNNNNTQKSPTPPSKGAGGGGRTTPLPPALKKQAGTAAKNNNSETSQTSRTSSRKEGRPMSPIANLPSALDGGARRSKRANDAHTVASALTTPDEIDLEAPPQRKASRPKSPFPMRPKSPFPMRPMSPFPSVVKKNSTEGRPKPKREMSVMDIA